MSEATFIITAVEPQKRIPNRVSIFIDHHFLFSTRIEKALELNLRKGKTLSNEQLKSIMEQCSHSDAKAFAYATLSRRSYSRNELFQKLRRKGFDLGVIESVIQQLEEKRLLSDEDYADTLLQKAIREKAIGKGKLRLVLQRRGITRDIAEKALNHADFDEAGKCLKAAEKKWATLKDNDPYKKQQKLKGYLFRQGFSPIHIQSAIYRVAVKNEVLIL